MDSKILKGNLFDRRLIPLWVLANVAVFTGAAFAVAATLPTFPADSGRSGTDHGFINATALILTILVSMLGSYYALDLRRAVLSMVFSNLASIILGILVISLSLPPFPSSTIAVYVAPSSFAALSVSVMSQSYNAMLFTIGLGSLLVITGFLGVLVGVALRAKKGPPNFRIDWLCLVVAVLLLGLVVFWPVSRQTTTFTLHQDYNIDASDLRWSIVSLPIMIILAVTAILSSTLGFFSPLRRILCLRPPKTSVNRRNLLIIFSIASFMLIINSATYAAGWSLRYGPAGFTFLIASWTLIASLAVPAITILSSLSLKANRRLAHLFMASKASSNFSLV